MKQKLNLLIVLSALLSLPATAFVIVDDELVEIVDVLPPAELSADSYKITESIAPGTSISLLSFAPEVGGNVEPIFAFAVGYFDKLTDDLSTNGLDRDAYTAHTTFANWNAITADTTQVGWVENDISAFWDSQAAALFGDITWAEFLAYDPDGAPEPITNFALFYTEDENSYIDSESGNLSGQFYVTTEGEVMEFSPTVIANAQGVFGGPAGQPNNGVATNDVPEPSSIALFGLGLVGLNVLRKKKFSS